MQMGIIHTFDHSEIGDEALCKEREVIALKQRSKLASQFQFGESFMLEMTGDPSALSCRLFIPQSSNLHGLIKPRVT